MNRSLRTLGPLTPLRPPRRRPGWRSPQQFFRGDDRILPQVPWRERCVVGKFVAGKWENEADETSSSR